MMQRWTFYANFALSLWVATALNLSGQQPGSVKGLDRVPAERRAGLMQRIEELVSLYQGQDWAGVYANLTNLPPIQETADQFRERMVGVYPRNTGRSLVAFVPENLVEQPANQWAVWGCATLQGKGKSQTQERWMLIASWERGGWFFSELLPASQLDAKKPMPCTTKQRRR